MTALRNESLSLEILRSNHRNSPRLRVHSHVWLPEKGHLTLTKGGSGYEFILVPRVVYGIMGSAAGCCSG